MKSLSVFLSCFLVFTSALVAGGFEYAYQVAYSNRTHQPNAIVTDKSNSVIIGGTYNSCIVCQQGFIEKRDGLGGGWFIDIDPVGGFVEVSTLSSDSIGNIYATIKAFGTDEISFGGGTYVGPDFNWSMLTKISPAGNVIWQVPFYGTTLVGTVDQGGAAFISNGDTTWKYSPLGISQWINSSNGGNLISVNAQDVFLGKINSISRLNKSNGSFISQSMVQGCNDLVAGGTGTVFFTGNSGTFRLQAGIISWSNVLIPGKAIARNGNDLWVLDGEQWNSTPGNATSLMTKVNLGTGLGLDTVRILGTFLMGQSGNLGIDRLGKLYTTLFWKDYGQYALFPPYVVWQDFNYSFEGYILSKYDPYLQVPSLGFAIPLSDPNNSPGFWNGDHQCPGGATFPVEYVLAGGNFQLGNTVNIELSDVIGDFTTPQIIGSLTTISTTGVVQCLLPAGLLPGTGYRIRLVSSAPALIGVQQTEPLEITSPVSTVASNGAQAFCFKSTTISCTAADPGFNVEWYKNGVLQLDGGGDTYMPRYSGNYSTVVTDYNGCRRVSDNVLPITVWPLPSAAISQSGNIEICVGSSVDLSVPNSASNSYAWYKNNVVMPGVISNLYTATSSSNYKVLVTTGFGCTKTSSVAKVKVYRSIITAAGPTTFCAGGNVVLNANTGTGITYQWKLNNTDIAGATTSSYLAAQAGSYKVFSASPTGCENLSSATLVTINCREGLTEESANEIFISPNPAIEKVKILLTEEFEAIKFEIYNSTGQLILSSSIPNGQREILLDINGISSGLYFIHFGNKEGGMINKKLIIGKE